MDPVGARVLRCGNGHGEFRVIGSVWGLPGFDAPIRRHIPGRHDSIRGLRRLARGKLGARHYVSTPSSAVRSRAPEAPAAPTDQPLAHCLIHMRLQGSRKAWRRTAHPRQHLRIHHEGGRRDGQVALRDQPTGTDDVWAKAREVEGTRARK